MCLNTVRSLRFSNARQFMVKYWDRRDVLSTFEKLCAKTFASRVASKGYPLPRHVDPAADLEVQSDHALQTKDGSRLSTKIPTFSRYIRIQRIFVGEDLKNWRNALRSVSKSAGVSYIPHVGAEDTGCKTMASTYDVWNACVWYVRV